MLRKFGTTVSRRKLLQSAAAGAAIGVLPRTVQAQDKPRLNILNSNVTWSEALTGPIAQAYTDAEITGESVPYEAHFEKLFIELSQGSSSFDILTSDCTWQRTPIVNGWAVPLDEFAAKNPNLPKIQYENLHPSSLKYLTYKDQHWGLPVAMTTATFVYRKDIFEDAGVDKVPENWSEYLDVAKKIHSSKIAGNVIQPATIADGDFFFRLMSMTDLEPEADGFMDPDNNPVFNSEGQGEAAVELLREISAYCPPGYETFDYAAGSTAMQQGTAAMMVSWTDVTVGIEDGPHRGKFGYTVLPSARFQQQPVGSWGMFINAKSENIEAAYRFFAWMAKGQGYDLIREAGESSLVLKSDIENPDIAKKIPMMQSFKDFSLRNTKAISVPFYRQTNAAECVRIVLEEVQAALFDRKTSKTAMSDAVDRVAKAAKSG